MSKILKIVTIAFSTVVSLFMCALTSSQSFLFSYNINYDKDLLNEIIRDIFNFRYMTLLNSIISVIFLFSVITLILYFFKNDALFRVKKYFSFFSILLLIIGLVMFAFYVYSFLRFYYLNESFRYFTYEFMFLKWMPKIIIFAISTLYLILVHISLIKKNRCIKLEHSFILSSIYALSLIFLTSITFCSFSLFMDYSFQFLLNLKTSVFISGDQGYGETHANITYYIFYALALTVVFGAIFGISKLLRKRRSEKQQF